MRIITRKEYELRLAEYLSGFEGGMVVYDAAAVLADDEYVEEG